MRQTASTTNRQRFAMFSLRSGSAPEKPFPILSVSLMNAIFKINFRMPAQRMNSRRIQKPARTAVWFRIVPLDCPLKPRDFSNQLGQFLNGDFLPGADVDNAFFFVVFKQKQAGRSQIVCVKKLALGRPRAPTSYGICAFLLGF